MDNPLRVLVVEDSEYDAELILYHLERAGYTVQYERVETEQDMRLAIAAKTWDLILSDYNMPGFSATSALSILQESGLDIPFIVVSGAIPEETAVNLMRAGAHDYLMKDKLARLAPVVRREIKEAQVRKEKRESEDRYRRLTENAPDIIFRYNLTPTLSLAYVNPAVQTITGYSQEECYADPSILFRMVHPKGTWEAAEIAPFFHPQLKPLTRCWVIRSGAERWLESRIVVVRDESGRLTAVEGIIRDITERYQAEQALNLHFQRQEKIASFGRELAGTLDLDRIYQTAERCLKELIDCPNIGITFYDPNLQVLKAAYLSSDGERIDVSQLPTLKINPEKSTSGRSEAVATKTPVIIKDLAARQKANGGILVGSDQMPQSAINVPMIADDQVIGLLDLQSYLVNAYSPEDGEWLSVIANQIGLTIQNARLFIQARSRLAELDALHSIDSAVTAHLGRVKTLEILLERATCQLGVDAGDILLYDPQSQELSYILGRGFHTPVAENSTVQLGADLAGKAVLEKRTIQYFDFSKESPDFVKQEAWIEEGFAAYVGVPLLAEEKIIGVLEVFHRSALSPDPDWLRFLELLAGQAASAVDHIRLFEDYKQANAELLQAYDATIEGWSQAMDLRDKETEGHTRRVTEIALRLAKALGIQGEALVHIRCGTLLHDIGELGVQDLILYKPGPLNEDEWVQMRKHPEYAYHMLVGIEYLRPAIDIPYCHHEYWDGSGYPRGLKGEEIPLEARIFTVTDVWDALTSFRPYRLNRPIWTEKDALNHIKEQSGNHFDPKVVSAFVCLYNQDGLKDISS